MPIQLLVVQRKTWEAILLSQIICPESYDLFIPSLYYAVSSTAEASKLGKVIRNEELGHAGESCCGPFETGYCPSCH